MELSPTVERRLLARTIKTDGCWLWQGSTQKKGYGQIANLGSPRLTHRIAYLLWVGPIPDDIQVDHRCHVRNCVRPSHLRPATQKQNQENRKGANHNSASGVRGVYWNKNRQKWHGRVHHNLKSHEVGFFTDLQEAEQAVTAKRQELYTHSK